MQSKVGEELRELSFQDLLTVKNTVGSKKFNTLYKNAINEVDGSENESDDSDKSEQEEIEKGPKKRTDKNKPMEMSSKRPVSRKRNVITIPNSKPRDPRFDPMSGKWNEDLYKRSYGFIKDVAVTELDTLKKRIQTEKSIEKKQELKLELGKLQSRINAQKVKEQREKIKREWKKKELERVKDGKKPFFLKKSELKKQELVEKYKEMGKGANMETFLEKRRKRNAAKEHRNIPSTRRSAL